MGWYPDLYLAAQFDFSPGVFAQPQQDWDKLVAAAEKECEVTIYGQARAGVAKSIHAFVEAYPKIKINFVGGQVAIFPRKFSLNDARVRILSMLQSAAVRR